MAAALLLLVALFSAHHHGRSHAFNLMNYLCNNRTSYGVNSTYQSNVVALLGSLASNASSSTVGFATETLGGAPDQVWGLALCRGDINATSCASCLSLVPNITFGYCRGVRDASIYYDGCLLRYSDTDFLAEPDAAAAAASPVQFGVNKEVNITSNPGRYVGLAADLIGALAGWAAHNSTRRYAAGVISSGEGFATTNRDLVSSIYGLVQCTPDLAPGTCQECLGMLRDDMPGLFNGTTGAQFNAVWCNLRYEVYPFYDGSPVVNLVAPPPPPLAPATQNTNRTKGSGNAATVMAIVLGVLVIVLASAFIIYIWRKAQAKQYAKEDEDAGSLLFDLTTLRRATANFAEENKLGHGGFGAVYKGFLPDGQEIAVTRLDKASAQGLKELRNELLLMAKLRHNNLAKLLGVCLKGQEKLLVYEYLPNRSLDTFLFAPAAESNLLLDWETRYRIIYGIARGLLYLHEDSQIKIIHRDLKASNVLLDADMNPKISDFGLARLFNGDKTTTITSQVVGTLGYMAPEYAVLGYLSVKLDVYSFGVLVLEVVTGRRNTDTCFGSELEEPGTLLNYVWNHWLNGTPLETTDPSLDCQEALESEVLKCIHLGLLCVQENPADRPTMLDVLMMLHGQEASFAAPSKPAFAFVYGERMNSEEQDNVSGGPGNQREAAAAAVFSVNRMSVSEFHPR